MARAFDGIMFLYIFFLAIFMTESNAFFHQSMISRSRNIDLKMMFGGGKKVRIN